MEIQCECGQFKAELLAFPKNTPGRLVCYCDDCQIYLHHLDRADLLDSNSGTEVVPAYPADVRILRGKEHLKCTRLSSKGMYRFSTTCCNTPIANTQPKNSWVGFLHRVYTVQNPKTLEQSLGPIRSRIMGRYAKGTPPPGTPSTLNLKALVSVLPFMIKGKLLGKAMPSPFFADDGVTPIVNASILSPEELKTAQTLAHPSA